MMHLTRFQIFPVFLNNFQTMYTWKIFLISPFPKVIFDFHSPKFLMTFFGISPRPFAVSIYFPLFRKHYYFPKSFFKFPPSFVKFTYVFYILFVFFVSPHSFTVIHLCNAQCTYWTPLVTTCVF